MPSKDIAERESQFIVFTFDKHGRVDAGSVFKALPADAYLHASRRSLMAGSKKFQVFSVVHGVSGALSFSQVEKAAK